jgi:alkanesulfonate monooxygenase SsuD/methylene tetrahydromethanopterin reductase-like flavin-dependent oxidoreductase (luciferase family)
MPLFVTPSEYSHAKHRIQELMVNSYRRNDKMSFGISLLVNMGDPDQLNINAERFSNLFGLPYEYFRKYVIKGSLEECADQISEFLEIEIDHVSLLFPTSDPLSDFLKLQNRLG